jgi:hypothetical protein
MAAGEAKAGGGLALALEAAPTSDIIEGEGEGGLDESDMALDAEAAAPAADAGAGPDTNAGGGPPAAAAAGAGDSTIALGLPIATGVAPGGNCWNTTYVLPDTGSVYWRGTMPGGG